MEDLANSPSPVDTRRGIPGKNGRWKENDHVLSCEYS